MVVKSRYSSRHKQYIHERSRVIAGFGVVGRGHHGTDCRTVVALENFRGVERRVVTEAVVQVGQQHDVAFAGQVRRHLNHASGRKRTFLSSYYIRTSHNKHYVNMTYKCVGAP